MSSIVELSKEIEQIDRELSSLIKEEVDLELKLTDIKSKVDLTSKHYTKLKLALDVLNGTSIASLEAPREEIDREPIVPPRVPKDTRPLGPICSACGDVMTRLGRNTRSGVYVEYLSCGDCGNEVYV